MLPKSLKSFLRDYFTLTSRERKGAMVLATIIVVQIVVIIFINYTDPPPEPAIEKYRIQLATFESELKVNDSNELTPTNKTYPSKPEVKLYPFNPNTITDNEWVGFGLSEKQVAIIRNYINKGGVFRKKEDVSKIFSISEFQYKRMESFIIIPDKKSVYESPSPKYKTTNAISELIDINTADTIELDKLPMIGAGRARLIFRYREALGGFVSANQLLEVFSIDTTVLNAIEMRITLDSKNIRKLNMNSDDLQHPYLTRKMTSVIKSYRTQHGKFKQPEDLLNIQLMNNEVLNKLAPYMTFE